MLDCRFLVHSLPCDVDWASDSDRSPEGADLTVSGRPLPRSQPLDLLPLALLRHAAERGEQTAVSFLSGRGAVDGTYSFGDLDRRARAIGVAVQRQAEPGARVVLLLKPGLDLVAAFLGCQYARTVAVPVQPPSGFPARGRGVEGRAQERLLGSLHRFASIAEDAAAEVVLTSSELAESVAELGKLAPALTAASWIEVDRIEDDLAEFWRAADWSGDDLCLLQYTSGSTSRPKAVAIAQKHLVSNAKAIRQLAGHEPTRDLCISWLPPTHDMGLIGTLVQQLLLGVPQIQLAPLTFLKRPHLWLRAISENSATLTAVPNFALDLCVERTTPESRDDLDLSSLRVVVVGAEPVRAATMDRFVRTFEPHGFRAEALCPCYGLAESTLIVSGRCGVHSVVLDRAALRTGEARQVDDAEAEGVRLVSCGRPMGDAVVRIVDPDTLEVCSEGEVGEIWVSSSHVASGYFGRPAISAETFEGRLESMPERSFLRTGDAGVLCGGELFITGRYKELMTFGGANHHPHDVEKTVIRASPLLREGRVVAFSVLSGDQEQLVVGLELRGVEESERSRVLSEIRTAVLSEHGLRVHVLVEMNPGALTRTTSGKPQRYLARQRYEAGELGEVL